jgi:mannose-6-phosphate isomerase-like protein (cupin superfamily)
MTHHSTEALKLSDVRIHMGDGPQMRPLAVTPDFWQRIAADPELAGGRLLGFYRANEPADLHADIWEMHPEGDELLVLFSGVLDIELEGPDGRRTVGLSPRTAFIVPAGVWHRLLLREPSTLVVITHREGTEHRKANGQ